MKSMESEDYAMEIVT